MAKIDDIEGFKVTVNRQLQDLFYNYGDSSSGWTGGDATYSVPLPDGSILWLFSDTFVGPVKNGYRPDMPMTKMINNCLVLQKGGKLSTIMGGDHENPRSFLYPDGDTWYWIGEEYRINNFVSKMRSYKPAGGSGFNWEIISSDRLYLKGSYKNSIRRLVYDYGGLIKRLFIANGIEKYTIFFVGERNLEDFYESLANVALIKHMSEEVLSLKETNELLFPNLTPDELNILSYSLRNGFFDSPRKLDMSGLKDNFNKSKSTLNYHLRKGIKKILNNYLME